MHAPHANISRRSKLARATTRMSRAARELLRGVVKKE